MAAHPEALLISAVIQSGEYQILAKHGITSSVFHVFPDEMEWLERYVSNHSRAPSKASMKNTFPEFVIYKVDDTDHWCTEVLKTHKQQALVNLADEMMNLIDAGEEDKALALIQRGATQIASSAIGVRNSYDAFDEWDEVYESVKTRVDRVRTKGYAGIPTGFQTFDRITGGLQPGWFGVIAARLGEGKTWTGIRMAWEAASTGHRVSYFSLEQSRVQISMRMHSFASRQFGKQNDVFNPMDLMRGKGFDLMEYKAFLKDMQTQRGDGKFFINDTSRGLVTPSTVAATIEIDQPDLVIIDYLTLLGTSSDDWRGTAKVSSELQGAAQKYDIPLVALSQVNRLAIGKEPPDASNLSQADAIGQDADFVLTTKRHGQSVQRMFLPKFRHGTGGDKWWAKFSPGTGEYEEIDAQDAADIIADEDEED